MYFTILRFGGGGTPRAKGAKGRSRPGDLMVAFHDHHSKTASYSSVTARHQVGKIDASTAELAEERDAVRELGLI